MNDYKNLEYESPQDMVKSIYHMLMDIVETYCERAETLSLDDGLIAELQKKYILVEDTIKYNMLDIPAINFNSLVDYCEKLKAFIGSDWREVQKKSYKDFLRKTYKEKSDDELSHIKEWSNEFKNDFYISISNSCRSLFNTELLNEGILKKIKHFFVGD